jgi:hypothetical protein
MKKYILIIGFLVGCNSGIKNNGESENNVKIEEKKWILSDESVMDYDSLIKNYEFLGEWEERLKMGSVDITTYMEFYNTSNKNTCYHVWKENETISIYEKKRDGNKYWGINKSDYYVITSNGELICYGGEGELQDKELLKSYGITFTKLR